MSNQSIMVSAIFLEPLDPDQGTLFAQHARLSEALFESLKKHPVPLEEAAIRAIANNSMALDVNAWLAYRLHVLVKPTPITWRALKQQFGAGFNRIDNFKTTFTANLCLALAVYRDARVEEASQGLVIHPCRPLVAPKLIATRSA